MAAELSLWYHILYLEGTHQNRVSSSPVNIVSSWLWAPQIVMSFYEEEHGQRKTIHQLIVASVSGKTRDESAESEATRIHG
jgi:hypothetical protein